MIYISPEAENKILDILKTQENPNSKVRIFVEGGGCSGFQYGFAIDEDNMESMDYEIPLEHTVILVDPISMQYLENIIVDYKNDLEGERFVINNPAAKTTCGCGSSFSPY